MPVATPTVLDTVAVNASSTTIASNSISPAGNAFLLVTVSAFGGNASLPASIGETFSPNLSWTQYSVEQGSGTRSTVAIFVAQTGATPGSGVVTVTLNAASARRVLHVVQIASGFNTSTPVTQSKTNTGTTAATVTLDALPAATSLVLGVLSINGTTSPRATPGATFSELVETGISSTSAQEVQYDNASAPQTVDWSTQSGTWTQTGVVALEIAEAAAGGIAHPLFNEAAVHSAIFGGQIVR